MNLLRSVYGPSWKSHLLSDLQQIPASGGEHERCWWEHRLGRTDLGTIVANVGNLHATLLWAEWYEEVWSAHSGDKTCYLPAWLAFILQSQGPLLAQLQGEKECFNTNVKKKWFLRDWGRWKCMLLNSCQENIPRDFCAHPSSERRAAEAFTANWGLSTGSSLDSQPGMEG